MAKKVGSFDCTSVETRQTLWIAKFEETNKRNRRLKHKRDIGHSNTVICTCSGSIEALELCLMKNKVHIWTISEDKISKNACANHGLKNL